jgi:hypothetical protein
MVIGFGHDMNNPGRSWAHSHVRPTTFIAAWRHIVNLFRRQGADNVSWLWTVGAGRADTSYPSPWRDRPAARSQLSTICSLRCTATRHSG